MIYMVVRGWAAAQGASTQIEAAKEIALRSERPQPYLIGPVV